ncbi:MAG TPA: glutaminyl-peptide cyclotransferase [Thermoanaerobaculia bacterium]|jgi:glutaminyl-peptide cyclotransferase|nr:glutaminyl-peptide cyclotransferase [Thermoanaerobaculia bacterium]
MARSGGQQGRPGGHLPLWAWGGLAVIVAAVVLAAALLPGRHGGVTAASPTASALAGSAHPPVERLALKVLAVHPHDPACYTQGLVWHGGELYESCGQYGQSSLRRTDPATGAVRQRAAVPAQYFAEGLALVGEKLLQLTWREGVALVYDRKSFGRTGQLSYQGEGWGLCYDGKRLVMSDGSDRLTLRDPATFAVIGDTAGVGSGGEIKVTREGVPVERLNELECVGDSIYANVWMTDEILRIDAATGRVTGAIAAAGLLTLPEREKAEVLNGIAWNPETRRFWITGKNWPKMFEVEIVPAGGAPRP